MSDNTLMELWAKIGRLKSFQFKALNFSESELAGWNGKGNGCIDLERMNANEIRTYETGQYEAEQVPAHSSHFKIQNAYQWILKENCIQVSHIRYGLPIKLLEIMPQGSKTLASLEAHICGTDYYSAQFCLVEEGFEVEWKIKGAQKDEKLFYSYFI